jgi:AraC-like DNA-binding protein
MSGTVVTTICNEAGEYESALGRAHLELTRTGAGFGPNVAREVVVDGAHMVAGHVQFPVFGRTTVGDDQMAVLSIISAPAGSRWCEHDLEPGVVGLYGPGAEHYAVSPAGLNYHYAVIDLSEVLAMGELLGTSIRPPARGSVTWLEPTASARQLRPVFARLGNPLDTGEIAAPDGPELFEATAHVLGDPSPIREECLRRKVSSRSVVSSCVEYADDVGRIPSVSELCFSAHVSERRLRAAFNDACDMSPNQFFRTRYLSRARERLLAPRGHTVTEIALDLGFSHLGRFAHQYEHVFDELPSETLAGAVRSTPHTAR